MKKPDHINHFCSAIKQTINEGGAKLRSKTGHDGLTTDMSGRWTIKAFDHTKANKNETPQLGEGVDDYSPVIKENPTKKFVQICAWCDKNKQLDRKYKSTGYEVSHGICKKHADENMPSEGNPNLSELIYHNNSGTMEVFKFFEVASNDQKNEFDRLLMSGDEKGAWNLIEKVLNVAFQGEGPWSKQ